MSGRRIDDVDRQEILRELDQWRDGELGGKLTWALLEKRFDFSRQALQAHSDIKLAYTAAKAALRGELSKTRKQQARKIDELSDDVEVLKATIAEYRTREEEWQRRWQRIAYHLRVKGKDVESIDKPIEGEEPVLRKREVDNIINLFDQPIPDSTRK